ncbi:MAG: leucine-rich repeat domain-containing protein [Clostridia bacterium]|nr:leucine-rich repeat domain-containing protein [Clostridia bacterium]
MNKTKKILSILLAAILIMTSGIIANAETYSGTCGDNLVWELDEATGVLTVSGTGEMYDYDGGLKTPWYGLGSSVEKIVIGEGVTSVGNHAFKSCSGSEVTISDTVETIGKYAFYGMTGLEKLSLGANVKTIEEYAFYCAYNLEQLVLPEELVTIGKFAFSHLRAIEELIIPDNVTTISDYAFSHCYSIRKIYIGDSVDSFPLRAFEACDVITEIRVSENNKSYLNDNHGVLYSKDKTTLARYPSASTYESYKIPDSVEYVAWHAFYKSNNLKSITMGKGIKEIGNAAFAGCDNITSLEFHSGLELVWSEAFAGCDKLESVNLPDTVRTLWYSAFQNSPNLNHIYYSGTEEQWNNIQNVFGREEEYILNETTTIHYLYGHVCDYGSWELIRSATCTEVGQEQRVCACGATETREIPMFNHSFDLWTVTAEPTCSSAGEETRSCSCGFAEIREFSPLGHTAGEWETVAEATCSADGKNIKKCTVCDSVIEEEIIEATEHTDNNNDDICDDCNDDLADNNDEQECDHACHKSGIAGFFWQITRFFNRLFRTNQYCECGAAHY